MNGGDIAFVAGTVIALFPFNIPYHLYVHCLDPNRMHIRIGFMMAT